MTPGRSTQPSSVGPYEIRASLGRGGGGEVYRAWDPRLGWVDVHLLASALIEHVPLWTLDRRLSAVSRDLGTEWAG